MGRILIIGDIHGNHKGLLQCLERCNFDNENDTLISLGDVVDGHKESFEVVEELLKIKNLIAIKGNHDDWFNEWLRTGINPSNWRQGQKATGLSYLSHAHPGKKWMVSNKDLSGFEVALKVSDIPKTHIDFFANQLPYYLDNDNRLFVHGGFNRHYNIDDQGDILWWDRDLWSQALSFESMTGTVKEGFKPKFKIQGDFKEIFIGHTSTQFWKEDEPMNAANIWNLDTGAGWFGKMSIMDVDTKEYWQSDYASKLYPEYTGRS
jgi:serine/threonine protein phosphatase 1